MLNLRFRCCTAFALAGLLSACAAPDGPAAPSVGDLVIEITGLPVAAAEVTVTGPNGYRNTIAGTTTLTALADGTYYLASSTVRVRGGIYAPSVQYASIVVGGLESAHAVVEYSPVMGTLDLSITGLPGGVLASVLVTGPDSSMPFVVTASHHFAGIQAGGYTVTARIVSLGATMFADSIGTQTFEVPAAPASAAISVHYSSATGLIIVHVSGTRPGTAPDVVVRGPTGVSYPIRDTGAVSIGGLPQGLYAVSAAEVMSGTTKLSPLIPLAYARLSPPANIDSAYVRYADLSAGSSLTLVITGLPPGGEANVRASRFCPYSGRGSSGSWRCYTSLYRHTYGVSSTWLVSNDTYSIVVSNAVLDGVTYAGAASTTSLRVTGADTVSVAYHVEP